MGTGKNILSSARVRELCARTFLVQLKINKNFNCPSLYQYHSNQYIIFNFNFLSTSSALFAVRPNIFIYDNPFHRDDAV